MLRIAAVSTLAAAILVVAAPAQAAPSVRWVDAMPANPTGECTQNDPCSLDHAWSQIASGDEIVLYGGEYAVATSLVAGMPVTIRGVANDSHPLIESLPGNPGPTLTLNAGGELKHLTVVAGDPGQAAVRVQEALVQDFAAVSADGVALEVVGAASSTLVRDGVVTSQSTNPSTAAMTLTGGGDVALRNLTIWADAGPDGVECELTSGAGTFVNVLVRGTSRDVDATTSASCTAKNSNFRPAASPGLASTTGNQSGTPVLVNTATRDFRPQYGSPTIDAGADDALLGTTDPDGRPRQLGPAVDIGAYETSTPAQPAQEKAKGLETATPGAGQVPAPAAPRAVPPPLQVPDVPPPPPVLGVSVTLGDIKGDVRVRTPRGRFVDIADAKSIPVGTVIDTRKGEITLRTALAGGRTQTGTFNGGMFEVRQTRKGRGMTDILLRGGSTRGCPRPSAARRSVARAAAKRKSRRRSRSAVVRRLWAKDKGGRFRTHGSDSVATVRGTRWLTEDRCNGTYTKVTDGAVDVRSKRTGRVRRVKAGRSLLVPATRRR